MNIGLYFGSFNPVHNGHLAIAQFLKGKELFDEIWFVVSPNNPLKNKDDLMDGIQRLNMVKLAIQNLSYLRACDVEFSLSMPSYTINTLNYLKNKYSNNRFSLIVGADNMENFHLWKDYKKILQHFRIYVYPRSNVSSENLMQHPHIVYLNAPLLQISSTEIRALLQQKKPVDTYLPDSILFTIH